jgi:hypothetical protein
MSTASGIFWAVACIVYDVAYEVCPPARPYLARLGF